MVQLELTQLKENDPNCYGNITFIRTWENIRLLENRKTFIIKNMSWDVYSTRWSQTNV